MYLGFKQAVIVTVLELVGRAPGGRHRASPILKAAASGGKTLGNLGLDKKSAAHAAQLSASVLLSAMNEASQSSSTSTSATRSAVEEFEAAVLKAAERAAAQAAEVRALEEAVDALRKK